MYCRNCGNEVSEKAVGCPKCGLDPRTEKNFCPNCGTETNEKQVLCTSCGVSLAVAPTSRNTSENVRTAGDERIIAIASYCTPLGFIIALIMHGNGGGNKSQFSAYHLRQSLGLFISVTAVYILFFVIIFGMIVSNPFMILRFAWLSPLLGLTVFILFIVGIINAASYKEKPVPLVGKLFENWFGNMFN